MVFSHAELTAIQTMESISGLLSVISCAIVLSRFAGRKINFKKFGLSNSHMLVLSTIDLLTSIFWSIGLLGTRNEGFCQVQGFMIQWGGLANIFWNCFMALQLHKWIAKKKSEDRLVKNIKKALFADLGATGVLAIILLGAGVYEKTELW